MPEFDDLDEDEPIEQEPESDRREGQAAGFRRLISDQITGLLDPDGAIRKGQGLVTGVTQATKEEVMRIISAEVRGFLDKMDAVDLMQQVVAGLVVDVNMQVRFSREGDELEPVVTSSNTEIREAKPEDGPPDDGSGHGDSGAPD